MNIIFSKKSIIILSLIFVAILATSGYFYFRKSDGKVVSLFDKVFYLGSDNKNGANDNKNLVTFNGQIMDIKDNVMTVNFYSFFPDLNLIDPDLAVELDFEKYKKNETTKTTLNNKNVFSVIIGKDTKIILKIPLNPGDVMQLISEGKLPKDAINALSSDPKKKAESSVDANKLFNEQIIGLENLKIGDMISVSGNINKEKILEKKMDAEEIIFINKPKTSVDVLVKSIDLIKKTIEAEELSSIAGKSFKNYKIYIDNDTKIYTNDLEKKEININKDIEKQLASRKKVDIKNIKEKSIIRITSNEDLNDLKEFRAKEIIINLDKKTSSSIKNKLNFSLYTNKFNLNIKNSKKYYTSLFSSIINFFQPETANALFEPDSSWGDCYPGGGNCYYDSSNWFDCGNCGTYSCAWAGSGCTGGSNAGDICGYCLSCVYEGCVPGTTKTEDCSNWGQPCLNIDYQCDSNCSWQPTTGCYNPPNVCFSSYVNCGPLGGNGCGSTECFCDYRVCNNCIETDYESGSCFYDGTSISSDVSINCGASTSGYCGDSLCNNGETCTTCPGDCVCSSCSNGILDPTEECDGSVDSNWQTAPACNGGFCNYPGNFWGGIECTCQTKPCLSYFDGTSIVKIACEHESITTSKLRVRGGDGTNYGIILVDPTDPNASKIRINTISGIKALRKL